MNVTTAAPPTPVREAAEHRFLLPQVGWQCYEALLAGIGNRRSIRITYDRGNVELMSPLYAHEAYAAVLGVLVQVLAEELHVRIKSGGTTTIRRPDLERGLEADRCYWIARIDGVLGRLTLDFQVDPPPDLAIEVEGTRGALDKMGVYAALGVTEVWRFDGTALFVHRLQPSGVYELMERSLAFPQIPVTEIVPLLPQVAAQEDFEARCTLRTWVREQIAAAGSPPV
jgi:Uma2 family endonuclease